MAERKITPPAIVGPPSAFGTIAVDGDTLKIGSQRIRLVGIDAPELRQTCRHATGIIWSCGREARAQMAALVTRGEVRYSDQGRDRYGRTLAACSAGDVRDLGEALVRAGYAVNTGGYAAAEHHARSERLGIWQGPFEHPQEWRRRHPRSSYH